MSVEKFYIKKVDDTIEHEISELIPGIEAQGITHQSPQLTPLVHQIAGSDGELVYPSYYAPSTVQAKFLLRGNDVYDYKLMASQLFRVLYSREPIQIHDEVEPYIVYCVIVKPFTITPFNFTDSQITVDFINPSGYRKSIVNSDAITNDMAIGMNIPSNASLQYHFNSNSFNIYNPSDVVIDPYIYRHQLIVKIKCNGKPNITNQTNNTSFAINGGNNLTTDNTLVLNGIDSLLDGHPYGLNTNMGYLKLEKGNNQISISGATDIDITFSFPFLYL